MKKILSLIIIVFFSTFSLIIKANSAQKEFYGTASTGVVELISSPIIVKNEELTFDIYKSDLNYGNVATKVSAKYTFYANMDRSNPRDMVAEIQLNLSEGSVHYIKLSFKGMNDVQLKEVEEKEGLKLLKDKKYKELPEFIEQ